MPQDDRPITLEEFEEQRRSYYGIPSGLAASLRQQESGGRQYDQQGAVITSPKQAKGRYQVLKSTAAKYGLNPDDPYENVEASFRYLSELNKQVDPSVADPGERWAQTLAGYHAGEGRLREVNKTGVLPSTSDGQIRTDEYVGSIMKRWQQHDRGETPQSARALSPAPQVEPTQPKALAPAEQQRRKLLTGQITAFEDLKRQGKLEEAKTIAADIKKRFGDIMEVGADAGWPYVKPKPKSAFTAPGAPNDTLPAPPAPRGVRGAVNQFVQSAIKGIVQLPEGAIELATTAGGPEAQQMLVEEMQREGKTPEQIKAELPARVAADKARAREVGKKEIQPLTNQGTAFAERFAPTDPTDQSWLTAKIPQALGSTVPFAIGSAISGGNPMAPAILGAASNAQQVAREFDAAGVDPAKRDRAILFAGGTGLTEAIGLGRALNKFGLGRAFMHRLADIAEEGGQEALQQWLNNVNAAYVGAYDPNRPQSKDVLENAILGAVTGGVFQGVSAGAERIRPRAEQAGAVAPRAVSPISRTAAPGQITEAAPEAIPGERLARPRPEEDKGLDIVRYVDQVARIESAPISNEDREAAKEAVREEYVARRRGDLSPEVQANLAEPPAFTPLSRAGLNTVRTGPTPNQGAIITPPSSQELVPEAFGYIPQRKALPPATGEEIIPVAPPPSRAVREVIGQPDPRFAPVTQQATQPLPVQQQPEAPAAPQATTKAEQETQQRNRTIVASRGIADQARQEAEAAEAQGRFADAREALKRHKQAISDLRRLIVPRSPGAVKLRDALGQQMRAADGRLSAINRTLREQGRQPRGRQKPVNPNAPTAELRASTPLLDQVNNPAGGVPPRTEALSGNFGRLARKQERGEGEAQDNVRIINRIRQLGGINPAGIYTGELRSAVDKKYPGLINRRDGVKPDTLRETLRDEGYPIGADLDSLFRAIDDDIAGKEVYPTTRSRTEEIDQEAADYYARQEEELRRQEEYNRPHERSDNPESLALPVLPGATERSVRQADTPTGGRTGERRSSDALAGPAVVAGQRSASTERLRVPKASPENIKQLQERRDKLSRLQYDRGGRLTGDLADEMQELGSRIAEFENEQAKAARGGRPETEPPPGGDERPFQPATAEDRRRALETVETRLNAEIDRATGSLPKEDAEALEQGVAAIDALFDAAEQDGDIADLLNRTLEGDADAEAELRNYANKQHGIDGDTFDSIIDARRFGQERGRVGQVAGTRRETGQPEAVNARYGEDRPAVETPAQAQILSAQDFNALNQNPAEIDVSAEAGLDANVEAFDRRYLAHLEDLRNRDIRGDVQMERWEHDQLQARYKQALEVRRQHVKDKLLPARFTPPPAKAKPLGKEEGGRRLVEQAKKKEAEKAEEPPTVTHPNPEIDRKPILAETNRGTVLVANPDNKTGVSEVKDRSDEPTDYKFSSTQVNLPKEIADQIIAFGKRIPDEDLREPGETWSSNAREQEPHITVKYGLHGADPKFVREALAGEKPATVKFGKVSLFETNDEFDVVKVDVDSPDLHRLNKLVAESQPVTDTFPDYKPHATIAYVKKGLGKKYAGDTFLEGKTATLDSVMFSGRDGDKVEIPLVRKEAPPPGPTRPLVTAPLNKSAIADRKRMIGRLMPFNIQGNKADLLAKGLGPVIERAAKGTKRTIDAFGGTGAYTHYLRSKGLGHEGDILNEFDPLRYVTHKQLKENPKEVGREAARTLTEVRQILKGVSEGERFSEKHEAVRRQVADYFQRRLNALVAPGESVRQKARAGETVEMQDTPETAGLYLIMQEQAFNSLPIQAEVTDDRVVEEQGRFFSAPLKAPHFRLPGFVVVTDQGGKVGFFQGKERLFETAERAEGAGRRMQGVDVRRGDGWELVRKEAGKGDLVPVDTSYLNRATGEETSNYSQATAEDAVPEVYMEKVRTNLLPAWDRGAKLVVTNNWDQRVADYLRSLGFDVVKAVRQGASKEDIKLGGAAELVAINFDKKTGEIFKRPEREDRPMASVKRAGAVTPERSEYWHTPPVPRTPSGFLVKLTPEQKAEQFEYSRAEFRQHATRARVYANEQGAFSYAAAINKIVGDGDTIPIAIEGVAVPLKSARKVIRYLLDRIAEKQSPARKEVYNNLAYALEQAVRAAERKGDQAITIVNTQARMRRPEGGSRLSLEAVRQVATHEETHVWQMNVGGLVRRGLFSDEVITSDPDYVQQRYGLVRAGYPRNMSPDDVSAEAIAHVAAGQWRDLGYRSESQAMKYLARVLDRAYTELGAEAVESLRLRTPKSKEARENARGRIAEGVGRSTRPGAPARTVAGGEVRGTQASLPGREREGRRRREGAGGEVQGTEPAAGRTALASVQPGGFTPTPDQSDVRKGYVRATDASGKTYIVEKKQAGAAPRAKSPQTATPRAQNPLKQATPKASKQSTPEQQALFERPRRESSGRDVSWYDYLASPLSNLNYKGTYERLAGETGKEISEAFRRAQQAIAKDQESRGKEIAQLERTLRGYQKQLRAEGKPGLANWLDAHVAALQDPDSAFKGVVGFLKKFQYDWKLRHNPRSIIINFLQPLQTLWPHLTTAEFVKISAQARQKETRERVAELAARESGGKTEEVDRRKKRWLPDIFGKVSESNRIMGHLAGELMADRLGLIGAAKARMGADWAAKVEFDNSRWNVPPLFRGRAAGVIGQFKAFTVKNLERLYADWKAQPEGSVSGNLARRAKIVTGQLALGGVRSLLLPGLKEISGVLILGGLAKALSASGMDDDDADKTAEALYFGAPGLVEQDLSSSVTLLDSPFGSTPSEKAINFLGGPTLSLIVKAWKEGETMATAKDSKEQTRGEKIKASALRLGKAVSPYTKFGETAYSLATTGKPPKLRLGKEEVEMTKKEAVGYGLMGTPLRQTKYYEKEDAYDWQKRMLGEPEKPGRLSIGDKLEEELRKHGLDYSHIPEIKGDTEKTHRERADRVERWLKQYGGMLVGNPRYKSLSEKRQKAALQNLRGRIGDQANSRTPLLTNLNPTAIIMSTLSAEREKPARDRRKIVVAPD